MREPATGADGAALRLAGDAGERSFWSWNISPELKITAKGITLEARGRVVVSPVPLGLLLASDPTRMIETSGVGVAPAAEGPPVVACHPLGPVLDPDGSLVYLQAENPSHRWCRVWDIRLSVQGVEYWTQLDPRDIGPRSSVALGQVSLQLPLTATGVRPLEVRYRAARLVSGASWELPQDWATTPTPVAVGAGRRWRVFLSRSLAPVDRPLGNSVATILGDWGLDADTVDEPALDSAELIRARIAQADAVVVLATPRLFDPYTHTFRTPSWLQAETGIAWAQEKPFVVIREHGVVLDGLIGELVQRGHAMCVDFKRWEGWPLHPTVNDTAATVRRQIGLTKGRRAAQALRAVATPFAWMAAGGLVVWGGSAMLRRRQNRVKDSLPKIS